MQLEQKYELLEAISDQISDRDQTIPAWERSTGKQVFVHLLAGGYSTENNVVLTVVGRLSPEHRQHVLGAGDHMGNAYVITNALPWGVSLRQWIAKIQNQPETQPSAPATSNPPVTNASSPAAASKPDAPDPSKLTRAGTWRIPVFNPDAKSAPAPPAPPPLHTPVPEAAPEMAAGPAPSAVAPDRAVAAVEPLAPPPAPAPAPAAPPAPAAATPVAVPEKEPGEFTRLMRTGNAELPATSATPTPTPTPSGSAAPASEPGEFTRLMRAGGQSEPRAIPEMPPSAPAAPISQDSNPGEFTQLLRSYKGGSKPTPSAPPAPPPVPVQRVAPAPAEVTAPPAPPPSAEAPWQFDKPGGSAAPDPFGMAGNPAPPLQPPPPSAPGGFTGMFQGQPQYPQAPPPPMAAPPPPMAPQAEGEFTRMMRTPASAGGAFAPPVQSGPADADLFKSPAPVVDAKGGPSFTQVIAARGAAAPAAGAPTPAAKQPAQETKKPPYLVLGLVLGLLLVLVIVLVLVLVLRK